MHNEEQEDIDKTLISSVVDEQNKGTLISSVEVISVSSATPCCQSKKNLKK